MTVMAPSAVIDVSIEVTCLAVEPRSAKNPSRRVVHKTDQKKKDDHLKHPANRPKCIEKELMREYIFGSVFRDSD